MPTAFLVDFDFGYFQCYYCIYLKDSDKKKCLSVKESWVDVKGRHCDVYTA